MDNTAAPRQRDLRSAAPSILRMHSERNLRGIDMPKPNGGTRTRWSYGSASQRGLPDFINPRFASASGGAISAVSCAGSTRGIPRLSCGCTRAHNQDVCRSASFLHKSVSCKTTDTGAYSTSSWGCGIHSSHGQVAAGDTLRALQPHDADRAGRTKHARWDCRLDEGRRAARAVR